MYDLFNETMSKIDELPLHPKNKILLYSCYLLSNISWELTVSDISKTWISETLDAIASKYIRKWLELPVSATQTFTLTPILTPTLTLKQSTGFSPGPWWGLNPTPTAPHNLKPTLN